MMLTELELAFVESKRANASSAHQDAHILVCARQDDACTVSLDDAVELLSIMHKMSLLRCNDSEFFAITAYETPDGNGDDLSWCALQREPNAFGRYEVASSFDRSDFYLRLESVEVVDAEVVDA